MASAETLTLTRQSRRTLVRKPQALKSGVNLDFTSTCSGSILAMAFLLGISCIPPRVLQCHSLASLS